MPGGDELLRRFGPGVFAMVAGYAAGWALLDSVGALDAAADRSSFLLLFLVVAVVTALVLDAAPLRLARRYALPRTWIAVAFVQALVLAACAPVLLVGVHLGSFGALQALVVWVVPLAAGLGYLAAGLTLGRIAR